MANSKVKIRIGAMQLVEEGGATSATVKFAEGSDKPRLEMVAYSGGVIKNHWFWDDLAIDLNGMSFPKKSFPLLEDHDTRKKLGVIHKMSIDGGKLTVEKADLLSNSDSLKFQQDSADGFPFEASIYAQPTKIQRLSEGEEAEVNGYMLKGPGTIWRKSIFKEASVVTFGYDSNTKSKAFAEGEEVELSVEEEALIERPQTSEEEQVMKFTEYKEKHPEEFQKLVDEVSTGLTAKFAEERAGLEAKLSEATAANTKLSEENTSLEARTMALEKKDALREEKDLRDSADAIFAARFSAATNVPARLEKKIRVHVNHNAFVKDGVLDKEAFAAACDKELADWAVEDEGPTVIGISTSTKQFGDDSVTVTEKLCEETADRMLKYLKA